MPLSEARAQLFDVVERAASGEHITLTNRGIPRAMLVPMSDDPRPIGFTDDEFWNIVLHHQMDPGAWPDIRFPGDTIGEDGLALQVPVITQDEGFVRLSKVGGPKAILI